METVFVLVGLAAMGAGAAAVRYFSDDQVLRRSLRRAPRVKISELAEGKYGRVVGRVTPLEAHKTLRAPLSDKACVYYGVIIQTQTRTEGWVVRAREVRAVPFVIDDGSGRAVVYFTDAKMDLERPVTSDVDARRAPPPAQASLLQRNRLGWKGVQTFRFTEWVLPVDTIAAVYGAGIREADPDAAPPAEYRGEPPTRLRLTSSKRNRLVISDSPDTTAQS